MNLGQPNRFNMNIYHIGDLSMGLSSQFNLNDQRAEDKGL